jgi:hypothetical protein
VKRALLTLCAVASVILVAACAGDDDDASAPAATLGTAATTTTTALTVEEEVEAAYLRSWEVYADAVLTFDISRLEESYADTALETVRNEVAELRAANTPVRAAVEHDIEITTSDDGAVVLDRYVNHSVLLDPDTLEPSEPDPDNVLLFSYALKEVNGTWKVVGIDRL